VILSLADLVKRAHRQLLVELAVAQNLEQGCHLGGQGPVQNRFEIHGRAVLEGVEGFDVDDRVVRAEGSVGETTLGHSTVDRHLTAFIAWAAAGTGALAPALVAAAGGLAQARTRAAGDALARLVGHALLAD
jgi:hypothetical protein